MCAFIGCAMIKNLTNSSEKKPLKVAPEKGEAGDCINSLHLEN